MTTRFHKAMLKRECAVSHVEGELSICSVSWALQIVLAGLSLFYECVMASNNLFSKSTRSDCYFNVVTPFINIKFGCIQKTSLCCVDCWQIAATFGNAVFGPVYGIFLMGGISRYANWKVIHKIVADNCPFQRLRRRVTRLICYDANSTQCPLHCSILLYSLCCLMWWSRNRKFNLSTCQLISSLFYLNKIFKLITYSISFQTFFCHVNKNHHVRVCKIFVGSSTRSTSYFEYFYCLPVVSSVNAATLIFESYPWLVSSKSRDLVHCTYCCAVLQISIALLPYAKLVSR